MGQEIRSSRFSRRDFAVFDRRLREETGLLDSFFGDGRFSHKTAIGGFELEAWLVDSSGMPIPVNDRFLERMNDPLVLPELAAYNVEINSTPQLLTGPALREMHRELLATWAKCRDTAASANADIVMVGIHPAVRADQLDLRHMSQMTRYRALNEQVLSMRRGRPLHLDIQGREHLSISHDNVMLEAAATSFQIHLQVRQDEAVRLYNASIIVSAPMVAACANSPFLFDYDLWEESRIPLFEQAVDVGGKNSKRVTFCNDYARGSLLGCFQENLDRYPVLLPMLCDDDPMRFSHLRLHNGTIWRWTRPLIGFDSDGQPHIRIEHRVVPAGPSLSDSIANAAFFFGLVQTLAHMPQAPENRLDFAVARRNFYRAAKHGLDAEIVWLDGESISVQKLLTAYLVPMANEGLARLGIDKKDIDTYLGVIDARVQTGRTGANWQRQWVARHGRDMTTLSKAYMQLQSKGKPVHQWDT